MTTRSKLKVLRQRLRSLSCHLWLNMETRPTKKWFFLGHKKQSKCLTRFLFAILAHMMAQINLLGNWSEDVKAPNILKEKTLLPWICDSLYIFVKNLQIWGDRRRCISTYPKIECSAFPPLNPNISHCAQNGKKYQ